MIASFCENHCKKSPAVDKIGSLGTMHKWTKPKFYAREPGKLWAQFFESFRNISPHSKIKKNNKIIHVCHMPKVFTSKANQLTTVC